MATQAEEASKASAQQLQDELSKGADKLKVQLADKDAQIAERDKKISELLKAVKDGEKGASEQLTELKKVRKRLHTCVCVCVCFCIYMYLYI